MDEDWRKSTRSAIEGACVEVDISGTVGVRDSKNPDGAQLRVSRAVWAGFIEDVKAGKFDAR